MPAEDVKTLREFLQEVDGYVYSMAPGHIRVLAVLSKRMADMIEREEQKAGCFECGAELLGPICPKCNPEVSLEKTDFEKEQPREDIDRLHTLIRSEILHRAFCLKCRSRRIGLLARDSNEVPSKDQIEWVESVADKYFPDPALQAAEDRIAVLETHLCETLKMLEAAYRQIGIHPDGKPRFVAARSALRREPRT